MLTGVATTSDWVAALAISIPASAALGGVWIKGHLDRQSEHRLARRTAYAEFISASRIVAARSFRYRFDQTWRGTLVSATRDLGPFLFSLLVLSLKRLRRHTTEAERIGLL